jgi:glycosyltransferase involved in cell wall biosynthesis
MRGASVIVISSIDWSFNRQNPQEVATAFAEEGNRVLFIENTGARAVRWRDARRLFARLRNWWGAHGTAKPVSDGIDVLSPLLLPFPYSKTALAANSRLLLHSVRSWLRRKDAGPVIVITFLPTPLPLALIEGLAPDVVAYYCIDRLAKSSPGARGLIATERRLFAEADLVMVTSGGLYDDAAPYARNLSLLPSGVHLDEYERARRTRGLPHPAFEGLTGPVVGFVGSLRDSTDLALIEESADLAPDLNFVIAGPRFTDVTSLNRHPNVRLLGPIPHTQVMDYMVRFDVGILPYVLNAFTGGVMPVKMKEYLAAGVPVVSTRLPEVVEFESSHRGAVRFATDAASFVEEIRNALAENRVDDVARRIDAVRAYDWRRQMSDMSHLIEEKLKPQGVVRFEPPSAAAAHGRVPRPLNVR